jgi:hypothetical protein
MTKILEINSCKECRYFGVDLDEVEVCWENGSYKPIRTKDIPSWCPLPNMETSYDEIDAKVNEIMLIYDKEVLSSPKGRSYGAWKFQDDEVVVSWEEYWSYGGHDTGVECFPRKWLEDGVDYKSEIKKLSEKMNADREKKIKDDEKMYEREERKKYQQLKKKFGDK